MNNLWQLKLHVSNIEPIDPGKTFVIKAHLIIIWCIIWIITSYAPLFTVSRVPSAYDSPVYTTESSEAGNICEFPFLYLGQEYTACTYASTTEPWCSHTYDYDVDRYWGYCSLGMHAFLI